jgi:hypothetical protein
MEMALTYVTPGTSLDPGVRFQEFFCLFFSHWERQTITIDQDRLLVVGSEFAAFEEKCLWNDGHA